MENLKKSPISGPWWQEPLRIFSSLSGWVILPLILGTTLGRWLDRRNDSGSKWFFICIGVAFIISTIGMISQARREYAKLAPPTPDFDKPETVTTEHGRTPRDN